VAEAKAKHGGRGAQTAKVWAAWLVLFVLSAAAFTACFQVTYLAVLGRAHAWFIDTRNRQMLEMKSGTGRFDPDTPDESTIDREQGMLLRLDVYGVGFDFDPQRERPLKDLVYMHGLPALYFGPLCAPVAFVLLWFARARMQLGPLDDDERVFQSRMLTRLAVPLLVFAAVGGALAAAGLSGTRLLQIRFIAAFNEDLDWGWAPLYKRDYFGRAVATFISCAAMLAIVAWGIYPFFARRTLRQLGRCAKCAYPRGATTTCPECGSSHA
jgi:hypothetical protein